MYVYMCIYMPVFIIIANGISAVAGFFWRLSFAQFHRFNFPKTL